MGYATKAGSRLMRGRIPTVACAISSRSNGDRHPPRSYPAALRRSRHASSPSRRADQRCVACRRWRLARAARPDRQVCVRRAPGRRPTFRDVRVARKHGLCEMLSFAQGVDRFSVHPLHRLAPSFISAAEYGILAAEIRVVAPLTTSKE